MELKLKDYFVDKINYNFIYDGEKLTDSIFDLGINCKIYIVGKTNTIILVYNCSIKNNDNFFKLNFEMKFIYEYKIPEGKKLEDYDFESPIVFTSYPYLRSFTSTLTANLNSTTPIIMPIINIAKFLNNNNSIEIINI